ncbi:ubiquitin-conjugating enzyme E2 T [Marchantia polymorpha subsp. ruderalis]|uniref:E2 ubiquitin-conjugating enzyme n=2 Tax=Marchantia polymorpha TaxID=3197 RepID=A0AAF6AJX2_MARPO|nr:hypothetical protein MARPO_0103s0054 [Marchantia polymorpha]BBM96742.1 hypothetical protein Mp_1g00330 [Marchantia polymorpha subsp. ruderalis]|eukprot:PTQ32086.1 hypothetical protein MARPO_0103s0054 [Marchantia polymorpha]
MQAARLATRLQRELRMLQSDPPPGVCAWPCNDSLSHLEAQIQGPDGTVYAGGLFKLEIHVPDRYPFEPPSVRFKTPIYHPNIDTGGRICLDILNMPPKGAWKPSLNMPTILASIGILLAEPNPDDGLMGDITAEYKHNRRSFDMTAVKWTQQYALQKESVVGDVSTPVQHNDNVQHKTLIAEGRRTSTVNGTKITNTLGTGTAASTSKPFLGTRLSLERGSKDSGKQSFMNTGDVDVVAVTSKRALACIDNTVGTRHVDQSLEISTEVSKLKGSENEVKMTAKIGGTSHVALNAEGCLRTGASNLFTENTVSTGPSSMDPGNVKRSPEARNIMTLTDLPPASSKQQTRCRVGSKPSETVTSISHASLSVSTAEETNCSERRSKYFSSSSFKAVKHASGESADALSNGEKANYLHPESVKSRICVAVSDACPVRIPPTHNLGYEEVRAQDHAAATSTPVFENGQSEETDRQTSSSSTSSLPIPSKKTVPSAIPDENSDGAHAKRRKQAALFRQTQDTVIQADFNGRIDRYFTASPVVRASSASPTTSDGNAPLQRCAAYSSAYFSNFSTPRSTDADMVLITGESGPVKPGTTTVDDRSHLKKKPPRPAKAWGATEVIVLDSESDEEPPKGRSRLSLSRRRSKNK